MSQTKDKKKEFGIFYVSLPEEERTMLNQAIEELVDFFNQDFPEDRKKFKKSEITREAILQGLEVLKNQKLEA